MLFVKLKFKFYNFMFWVFFRRVLDYGLLPFGLGKYQYKYSGAIAEWFARKIYLIGYYPVDWKKYP